MGSLASPALVSVIIPCYNQAKFLSDAIGSVLAQTWERIELIVVDDGSTDNTSLVVQQFSAARYLCQPNRGLAAARNAGLGCSGGQFIAFLDADDRLLPDALEHGVEWLLAHQDYAFVHGDYRRIDAAGAVISATETPATGKLGYAGLLQKNYIAMHGTVLYRKNILEIGGGFDSSLPACEDYELYLRIARTHRIGHHPHLVAEVREHAGNMSRNFALMLQTSMRVLRAQKSFVRGNKELESAFTAGRTFWRDWYGEKLAASVNVRLRISGIEKNTLSDMMTLFHYYPRGSVSLARLFRDRIENKIAPMIGRSVLRQRPVSFADLRRLSPVSRDFGFERGTPIDRYYVESFLLLHSQDIQGRVLEAADNSYTLKFGKDRVTQSVVVNLTEKPGASIVADLTRAEHIPSDTFDCVILTQTLHLVFDLRSALRTIYRILRPGGVLLLTVPGISQICIDPERTWSDFWRFTDASVTTLLEEVFPSELLRVQVYGNVLSASAFLYGLAVADMKENELDHRDPQYQVIIAGRAQKETR